jgi:hypothetical protein
MLRPIFVFVEALPGASRVPAAAWHHALMSLRAESSALVLPTLDTGGVGLRTARFGLHIRVHEVISLPGQTRDHSVVPRGPCDLDRGRHIEVRILEAVARNLSPRFLHFSIGFLSLSLERDDIPADVFHCNVLQSTPEAATNMQSAPGVGR